MRTLLIIVILLISYNQLYAQQESNSMTGNNVDLFEKVELFPNPTSEIIFIKNGEEIESYVIYDLHGSLVQSGVKNAQIISLIDLPVGYYLLEMKAGERVKRIKIQKY